MASATLSTPSTATFCMPSVAASTFSKMKGHICNVAKMDLLPEAWTELADAERRLAER